MTKQVAALLVLAFGCAYCLMTAAVYAETFKSANYQVDESFVGNGGLLQSGSANYQLGSSGGSLGDTGTGNSASANYQVEAGSNTTGDPALSCGVTSPNADFGSFSPASAAVATSTFRVSNYTSYGYVIQIAGDPPSNGNYTLAAMSSNGPSQAGTEQFGINLVANTSPVSVGANPDHGDFGVGSAATNYDTANSYRYVDGETIASGPKSSGITTYTITYLVNVTSLTPGGKYTADQSIICTGTF